jgi:hypothetical protein
MVFAGCVVFLATVFAPSEAPTDTASATAEAPPIQRPTADPAPPDTASGAAESDDIVAPEPDPVADTDSSDPESVVAAPPVEAAPVPPPEAVLVTQPEPLPAPEALPSTAVAPEAAPAPPNIEMPEWTGRGLIRGALAAGAVGWTTSLTMTALAVRGCDGCTTAAVVTLIGGRWVGNGAALGLAIPGGIYRGRYHATAGHLGRDEVRDPRRFIVGGATAVGIGSVVWFVTRAWGAVSFFDDPLAWGSGAFAGYFTSLQVGWTAATIGAGFLSYGLSLENEQKRLGRLTSLHVLPQLGRNDAGLAVAGRF